MSPSAQSSHTLLHAALASCATDERAVNRVKYKTSIVAGGALGIGRSIATLLAREGARLAVADIQDGAGRQTADDIQQKGGTARFWHLDVSDEAGVALLYAATGIRVNSIHPGFIWTRMVEKIAREQPGRIENTVKAWRRATPLVT
jgi:NAD(P)-dependent dehydrogenase (short-subunit alcohol dehydrogenase family)